VESTPLRNPFWAYSRDKIACENMLTAAYGTTKTPPASSRIRASMASWTS